MRCPNCGRSFPIRDGIPDFLPVGLGVSDTSPPTSKTQLIKWKQQQQRDREARNFEEGFSEYSTKVDIKVILEKLALERGDILLDSGAGTGRLARHAAKYCTKVVALDFSQECLTLMRKNNELNGLDGRLFEYVLADVEQHPFRDGVFDKIISFGILEHLPDAESMQRVVLEFERLCKIDGITVATAYNLSPLRKVFARLLRIQFEKQGWHDEIFFRRMEHAELKGLFCAVSGSLEISGVRNIPKRIGEMLPSFFRRVDAYISRSSLSRIFGYYLIAKLRKKKYDSP